MSAEAKRVPAATYRLQFNLDFTFLQAEEILDYLHELGISDVYVSPLFRAGAQSTHGYDVCCFGEVSPLLGGLDGFSRFSAAARELGFGLLLDMVPNHMGSALTNEWWVDVLRRGAASEYAQFFDIDWNPPTPGLRDKVLLPVLEDHYWKVMEHGKVRVVEENGEFAIAYHDHRFPIAPESKASPKQLHQLLQEQHYRLAYWRVGPHEINYRRFFDVTELVSLRMEREEVFEATHELLFQLIDEGLVTGLRIDHPDGLWDPKQYFNRLQKRGPIYVIAEKILTGDEPLPENWAVEGTTGYDFLNHLNGMFVDQRNEAVMTQVYQDVTGCTERFDQVVYAGKKKVLAVAFQSEVNALAHQLKMLPQGQDFTLPELRSAITEMVARFPVYRTYATESAEPDHRYVDAIPVEGPPMQFLRDVLLMKVPARQFVMKFQQLTGPVTAKGVEDTAFYNYNRLLSLNEVGGSPGTFGVSVEEFHRHNIAKQKRWPHSLLATATHDSKRGEDLRARLNVLSEMPDEWREVVSRWIKRDGAPTANDQYLLFQTLIGAWDQSYNLPEFEERICAFMLKAMREAKSSTSWTDPNREYEEAAFAFVRRVLALENPWWNEFRTFHERVAFFGRYNSLSQLLLKLSCPGVPDVYQGTELWDFNLVDPDNRRSVDYKLRRGLLARLKAGGPEESKLYVIWRTLEFRNANRELFDRGDYVPIAATTQHVCAFARTWNERRVIVIAPRLVCGLCGGKLIAPLGAVWENATLETEIKDFRNVFTGEMVSSNRLADVLKTFPIALLARR